MLALALACAQPEEATVAFSDATLYGLEHFDDAEAGALAVPIAALVEEIGTSLDMSSEVSADRALEIAVLVGPEVEGIPHPDRDPAAAVPPVALARDSLFPLADHVSVALRDDLSPMEPNSPNLYARTFLDGESCFAARDCLFLRTTNDVLKENALMSVQYELLKDYRWVELEDGTWAMAARSWMPDSATGEDGGTTLWQSFTFEMFVPQGDGTLRMMALWAETELSIAVSEDDVALTQIVGIDDIFETHDEWLTENGG